MEMESEAGRAASPRARWLRATGTAAALLAWLLAYPLYHAMLALVKQAGPIRTLGVAAVGTLLLLAAAAGPAALAVLAGLDRRVASARLAGDVLFAAASVAVAVLGLTVTYTTVGASPGWAKAAAAGLAALLLVLYRRNPPEVRAVSAGAMRALALAALAVPLAATPLVAWAAWTDAPRLPTAVDPPTGPARPDAPRRIVLLTFDGLRGRSVRLDGDRGSTPHLAALAREADRYDRAIAAGDQTRVSVPAFLTGLRPPQLFPHLANAYGVFRHGGVTGIAGHLAPAGYRRVFSTAVLSPGSFGMRHEYDGGGSSASIFEGRPLNTKAFLPLAATAGWLDRRFLRRGGGEPPLDDAGLGRTAIAINERVLREAVDLLASGDRVFLWVHSFVPHSPYVDVPPEDLGKPLDGRKYRRVLQADMARAATDEATRVANERVYERFVRYGDDAYGRFEGALRARGLWDDTLLIVTADHGESFQPGQLAHASGHVAEQTVEVPFLVKPPGRKPGQGRHLPGIVGHEDVLPTILGAVYGAVPAGLPGRDLGQGPPPPDRTLLAWAPPDDQVGRRYKQAAAFRGRFKLVRTDAGAVTLHDLAADPEAVRDVRAAHPALAAELEAWLRAQAPQ